MSEINEKFVGKEAAKGMKTELKARKLLLPYDSEFDKGYKSGFNDAMDWAIQCVDNYEKGDGLFQL